MRRGVNTRVATLTQHAESLSERAGTTLNAMVKGLGSTTLADGSVMRPDDLLERLGFTPAQRLTPIGRLSGGQRRRLQFLLVMLSEPNVLVLDEPTNDLDTDMLAAMEDLLDQWPGTLVVVSHDRYLLERITDQQYAVVGGTLRHLPGGVDEYIALSRDRRTSGSGGIGTFGVAEAVRRRRRRDAARQGEGVGGDREEACQDRQPCAADLHAADGDPRSGRLPRPRDPGLAPRGPRRRRVATRAAVAGDRRRAGRRRVIADARGGGE